MNQNLPPFVFTFLEGREKINDNDIVVQKISDCDSLNEMLLSKGRFKWSRAKGK